MVWSSLRDGYMLSPYYDLLAHFFHKPWRSRRVRDHVGMMIKLADTADGEVLPDGTVHKALTLQDTERLGEARAEAVEVMEAAGVEGPFVDGVLNGGHMGGTVPLEAGDVATMRPRWLPEGVWVAGAPDGTAVAVKTLDGANRVPSAVAVALLAGRGAVAADAAQAFLEDPALAVLGGGQPVGRLRVLAGG